MQSFNIAFAGAGKVASALSSEMHVNGHTITQLVSPGKEKGEKVALLCGAKWSDRLVYSDNTDIILVAVPDHKLKEVLADIICSKTTLVAHTAGSFGLDVFPKSVTKRGVFYPLQTFTVGRNIIFSEVPLFTEADDEESAYLLRSLGESLGCSVYNTGLEQRQLLHAAAVFVSNFTNYMLTCGKDISAKAGLPFDLLQPLIRETINKALEGGPAKSQTGPAVRNDLNTIEKHLELLSFSPELKNLYKEISESLMNYYKQFKNE
jgi:predicted short-subunit dehydrogenase-like oxidoreductase (DUF2520 family)